MPNGQAAVRDGRHSRSSRHPAADAAGAIHSRLLAGDAEILRQCSFTRWMSRDLLQPASDFLKNLRLDILFDKPLTSEMIGSSFTFFDAPRLAMVKLAGPICDVLVLGDHITLLELSGYEVRLDSQKRPYVHLMRSCPMKGRRVAASLNSDRMTGTNYDLWYGVSVG